MSTKKSSTKVMSAKKATPAKTVSQTNEVKTEQMEVKPFLAQSKIEAAVRVQREAGEPRDGKPPVR
jgi:hypothetical protein